MAVQLPIINGSSGVWGSILNDAIIDIDTRVVTATTTNVTQTTDITTLAARVATLETTSKTGYLVVTTAAGKPPASIGQMGLETDTGYLWYVASISGVPTRVPWPGSYLGKCRQTTAQNIAAGTTGSPITFQTCDTNRLNGWSSGSKWTAPVRGLYEFSGAIAFTFLASPSGYRAAQWMIDGAAYNASRINVDPVEATNQTTVVNARSVVVSLNAGQYVELYGAQTSSSTIATDVSSVTFQANMSVKYMGYYGS